MLVFLTIALTLAIASGPTASSSTNQVALPDDCKAAFILLYDESSKVANEKRYVEAAALRQTSADIFQGCLFKGKAPRNGQYPLDGVSAYIVAADFWHLAGQMTEAQRSLATAKSALHSVLKKYPETSLPGLALGELTVMRKMIRDDEAGCWGVWQESDEPQAISSVGEAQILPPYPCALRNP